MMPGPNLIKECPYCGAKKQLMSLMSGNTFAGRVWSDLKEEYPMMPRVSSVQRCETCGKYYFLDESNGNYAEKDSWKNLEGNGLGKLSYAQWKEAYEQKVVLEGEKWDVFHKREVCMKLIEAYNDKYNREGISVELDEKERAYIKEIINVVMDWLDDGNESDRMLKAEYMRETGRMEDSLAYLCTIEGNEQMKKLSEDIRKRAESGIMKAFEIQF